MECEVCGAPEAPFLALIEGAKLHACPRCAHMGKIINSPGSRNALSGNPSYGSASGGAGSYGSGSSLRSAAPEFELVEGFGTLIRAARLRMKLPLSVLAERLAEKESFLERVEGGKTHPSPELARKLQKELNVTILEASETLSGAALVESTKRPGAGGRTLGDIVELEQKKKKK